MCRLAGLYIGEKGRRQKVQKIGRVGLACQTFIGGRGDKNAKNGSC
jgi:hypothetical protein